MSNLTCPSCGSDRVQTQNIQEMRQLTLGPEFKYTVPTHVCENCGEEGDFNGEGDSYREKAIEQARKELAGFLIDDIQANGMKLSYIERAFELPQRTISSKWRGGISASGLALLRIIKSMPWVVNVADNKFTSSAISQELGKLLLANGATFESTVGESNGIHMTITRTANSAAKSHAVLDLKPLLSTGT